MAPHTCPGSAPAEARRGQGAALGLPTVHRPFSAASPAPEDFHPRPEGTLPGSRGRRPAGDPWGTPSISSGGFAARRRANTWPAGALGVPGTGLPKPGTQTASGLPDPGRHLPRRLGVSSRFTLPEHRRRPPPAAGRGLTCCPMASGRPLPLRALPLPECPASCSSWGAGVPGGASAALGGLGRWVRTGWLSRAGASASAAPWECGHVTNGLSQHPQG